MSSSTIAARHKIKPLIVFFDSCWDPNPKLGPQHPPIPGVHNSGWVQSPGTAGLADTANYPKLKVYVQGVIRAFGKDDRILGWDIWNEPDNGKVRRRNSTQVEALLPQAFAWAREADPSQPLTSGVWHNDDWSLPQTERRRESADRAIRLHHLPRVRLAGSLRAAHQATAALRPAHRRHGIPGARRRLHVRHLAAHRGEVQRGHDQLGIRRSGRRRRDFPWDSWQKPYTGNAPAVWHHDVFHADGKPYRQAEIDQIRALTSAAQKSFDKSRPKK